MKKPHHHKMKMWFLITVSISKTPISSMENKEMLTAFSFIQTDILRWMIFLFH